MLNRFWQIVPLKMYKWRGDGMGENLLVVLFLVSFSTIIICVVYRLFAFLNSCTYSVGVNWVIFLNCRLKLDILLKPTS